MTTRPPALTLLTQHQCALCDQAKEILGRVSAEGLGVVRTVDVSTPEGTALAVGAAMAFPPALLIDGEPFCYGRLSERRLRRELSRRAQR